MAADLYRRSFRTRTPPRAPPRARADARI